MRRALPALAALAVAACASAPEPSTATPGWETFWDFGDPAGTEERFRAVLPTVRAEESRDEELQLRTQIARALGLQGRFDAARAELDAVDAALGPDTPVAAARAPLERGRVRNSSGDPAGALPLFVRAFERADAAAVERLAADALHMCAIAADGEDAERWSDRAIAYCEASDDPATRRWLGPLAHNRWVDHLERDELAEALPWAERARGHRAAAGDEEGERIARWCVAHTLRRLGRVEEARASFERQLAEYEALDPAVGDPYGYVHEELGECLHALGRADEARVHFAAAYERLREDPGLRSRDPERLARLARLGGVAQE